MCYFSLAVVRFLQNHEEFRGLERAKEAMVDVAQYINEVKRDSEVLALLAKVQVRLWEYFNPCTGSRCNREILGKLSETDCGRAS